MTVLIAAFTRPVGLLTPMPQARSKCQGSRRSRRTIAARQAKARGPMNRSERCIADLLDTLRIDWDYEPRRLGTGLTGKAKRGLRPDFWLPEYNLYLEITEAEDPSRKRKKIAGVKNVHGITVILIDKAVLQQLRNGTTTLFKLIQAHLPDRSLAPAIA